MSSITAWPQFLIQHSLYINVYLADYDVCGKRRIGSFFCKGSKVCALITSYECHGLKGQMTIKDILYLMDPTMSNI